MLFKPSDTSFAVALPPFTSGHYDQVKTGSQMMCYYKTSEQASLAVQGKNQKNEKRRNSYPDFFLFIVFRVRVVAKMHKQNPHLLLPFFF